MPQGNKKQKQQKPRRSAGQVLKKAASRGIDAYSYGLASAADSMMPGSGILVHGGRELLRDLTGFSERRLKPAQSGGGGVVTTQSAPVAFPRRPDFVGKRILGNTRDGHTLIHVHDLVGPLTTSGTANTYTSTDYSCTPTYSGLLPNMYVEFENFDRFRLNRLRLHFDHFCPTSQQSAVGICWIPDNGESTPLPDTMSHLAGFKNCIIGAGYEDFCLDVDPKDLASVNGAGLWNDVTAGTSDDARTLACGFICVASDQCPQTSVKLGYLWVEAIWEVWDQRPAGTGVGLAYRAQRFFTRELDAKKRAEKKAEVLAAFERWIDTLHPTARRAGTGESLVPVELQPVEASTQPAPLRQLTLTKR